MDIKRQQNIIDKNAKFYITFFKNIIKNRLYNEVQTPKNIKILLKYANSKTN